MSHECVLLMDRDLAGSALRSARLTLASWQVVQTVEEAEALTAVRSRDVDVVLLHLPVEQMVSMDFVRVLRQVSPSSYLPVMVLTDTGAERTRCRFLDSGADDVICASASAEELVARVRSQLRVKALHDELVASRAALRGALKRERYLLARLRKDYADLQQVATTDPLTHVQNVRSFNEILSHEFKIAKRYSKPLSLLMMDVDHFKVVNDTHGHPSGDYVLKEVAVILRQCVRESDVVARTGGEEFNVLLPRADGSQARRFADRIRREVYSRHFIVFGNDIHVTISVGSASFPANAEITEPGMLVYFADQALLAAKQDGRDRVVNVSDMDIHTRRMLRRQYHDRDYAKEEDAKCPTRANAGGARTGASR